MLAYERPAEKLAESPAAGNSSFYCCSVDLLHGLERGIMQGGSSVIDDPVRLAFPALPASEPDRKSSLADTSPGVHLVLGEVGAHEAHCDFFVALFPDYVSLLR